MEATILTEVLLPLALATIMLGMGLSLTPTDFSQLWRQPKPVLLGLVGQLIILPCIALALIGVFNLSSTLAIGLMIIAACPGGSTSNIISHVARANMALSVSLTALSTTICIVTTPLIISTALIWFGESTESFSILGTTLGLLGITLIPIMIGMFVKAKANNFAVKSEKFFRAFSVSFLALMILLIVIQEWDQIAQHYGTLVPSAFALTLLASFSGFALGKATKEPHRNALTLGIEVGIQNATLAIFIAITFLDRPDLATAAGMYGLVMYVGALLLITFAKLRNREMNPAAN